MKMMMVGALALSIAASTAALAQPHGDGPGHGPGRHGQPGAHQNWGKDYGGRHKWKRGQRMGYNDWNNAPVVDYRRHHLRQPPRGYEWRESNGQYILAAVATGVIASIILNAGH